MKTGTHVCKQTSTGHLFHVQNAYLKGDCKRKVAFKATITMTKERVTKRIPSHQNGGCDSKEPGFTPHEKKEEKTTNFVTSKPNVVVAILQLCLKVSLCLMTGLVFGIAQEKGRGE